MVLQATSEQRSCKRFAKQSAYLSVNDSTMEIVGTMANYTSFSKKKIISPTELLVKKEADQKLMHLENSHFMKQVRAGLEKQIF